jgi:predicted SAM-dependent methyltransferase
MTTKQRLGRWTAKKLPINSELLSELRFETNAFLCRVRNGFSHSYRKKIRHLRTQKGLNLNVGSGGRGIPQWLNVDALGHHSDQSFSCDVRKGLPLADGSVDRIFAEHVIEHFNFKHELPDVLREFLRILKSGGKIRIIVPDGRRFTEAYVKADRELWASLGLDPYPDDMPTAMALLNHVFHQGGEHHFAYDYETLEWVLRKAGFVGVQKCAFGESSDPVLAIDRTEHSFYSLYVEANKP